MNSNNSDPLFAPILRLPPEIWAIISELVANRDLKSLRLANTRISRTVALRLDRVFLSPNPRNVEVFRAIADHEEMRHRVVEIIYDDARLPRSAAEAAATTNPAWFHERGLPVSYSVEGIDGNDDPEDDNLAWFRECRESNDSAIAVHSIHNSDVVGIDDRERRLAAHMPLEESFSFYKLLVRQQDAIIESGTDFDALVYGLQRFPALRTVTITPAAHGYLFNPLYETPMIRSFPFGFDYPIPRGWPGQYHNNGELLACRAEALPWVGTDRWTGIKGDTIRDLWRGYCGVTRILADQQQHHNVTELLIDERHTWTGLNCNMFRQPCDDYHNFVSIVSRPGFGRIHISLLVGREDHDNWPSFRSGLLRQALAQAPELKSFTLTTDADDCTADDRYENFLSLHTFMPVDRWACLQHFGFWTFQVYQDDLFSILAALPPTLESLELGNIHFFRDHGSFRDLLFQMRDELDWKSWGKRPTVSIAINGGEVRDAFDPWYEETQ